MNTQFTDYFDFLTETLGVRQILAGGTFAQDSRRIIGIESLSSYTPDEVELLDKILLAARLNRVDFDLVDLNGPLAAQDLRPTLLFVDAPENHDKEWPTIFSPRVLLRAPQLKRKAWDDLQRHLKLTTK